MSVLPVGMGSSGVDVGDIGHSLRLRAAASAYLSRTFGTPTTAYKWTISKWIKRGKFGSPYNPLFGCNSGGYSHVNFDTNDRLSINIASSTNSLSNRVFRDPSGHGHLVITYDNSATPKLRAYWGNEELTWGTDGRASLTNWPLFQSGVLTAIGAETAGTYFDGYLSRICFIDGQALTPSSFGYQNTEINEWVSKSQSQVLAVVEAGGTNSFMLDFDDATSLTTLGYDKSTKNNDWTLNNISLTAGVTYDHMLDTPTNNYATLDRLNEYGTLGSMGLSEGNLSSNPGGASQNKGWSSTIAAPGTGKWYAEFTFTATSADNNGGCGVMRSTDNTSPGETADTVSWRDAASLRQNASGSAYGSALSVNDVVMIAYDAGAGKVWFGKQGTWFASGDPGAGANHSASGIVGTGCFASYHYTNSATIKANFGQRPFAYTPPTGFLALCTANLPTPAILNPTDHFHVATVTKSGNTNFTVPWDASVYDTLFEIKRRNAITNWYQVDGLRGYDKYLSSNSTAAEVTDANVISVSGTTATLKSTLADGTYVVTCWKAGLTAARQTNTDGSITSTVSRNVTAGFSIVKITAGTAANATVGHGLGVVPRLIVSKAYSQVTEWPVYSGVLANTEYVVFNTTAPKATGATYWNSTTPTSSVLSLGSSTNTNNTNGMIFYCHAEIEGYSKIGSYTGNGSTDGPFAWCGGRLMSVMVKQSDVLQNWLSIDSARDPTNVVMNRLYPNTSIAEDTDTVADITAQGFKPRTPSSGNNAPGGTYTFIAIAAVAGKFSNAR